MNDRTVPVLLALILASTFLPNADVLAESRVEFVKSSSSKQLLRPSSMCWVDKERKIAIANSSRGSISLMEVASGIVREANLGGKPVCVRWLKQTGRLAVVDQAAGELVLANPASHQLVIKERLFVGRGAGSLVVSENESLLAVTSLWDRSVSIVSLGKQPQLITSRRFDFEPGLVCFSPDNTLLFVFDAFAGQFAVLNANDLNLELTGDLQCHQIRGVAFLAADRFVITHQILHSDAATTAGNIAAGRVIENVFQEIQIKLSSERKVLYRPLLINEIGVPSHGAADPSGVVIDQNGDRYIALSGVNEVAITNQYGVVRKRLEVGKRPVDLLLDEKHRLLYCLNQIDQSISVIDIAQRAVTRTISLGSPPVQTSRSRGEELFFDARSSRFGWYSCQSCHAEGHTSGQLADTFGDGTVGAPKRVLSLLGGRDNNPWAWNGSMRSLHDQVLKSGITTMRGPGFSAKETNDVVAFLHTFELPPPFRPATDAEDQRLIDAGKAIFFTQGCSNCHVPPLTYTADTMFDVGLTDEHGAQKFNPPSLNAVGYRRAFFHDGRAKQLEDVLVEYGHQLNDALSEDELRALVRFLESL